MNHRRELKCTVWSSSIIAVMMAGAVFVTLSAWAETRAGKLAMPDNFFKYDRLLASGFDYRESPQSASVLQRHRFRNTGWLDSDPWTRSAPNVVPIEAIASGSVHELKTALEALGLEQGQIHDLFVTGYFPVNSIDGLGTIESLHEIRRGDLNYSAGVDVSEGDRAIRADQARMDFGVSGTGVTVGVVSDSFNCLGGATLDIANGELPASARVIQEAGDCTDAVDEGRALMQIIHDVAPGAELIFHTGGIGTAGVAHAIATLQSEGADIIIDDAKSPFSTFYQDDAIARSVRDVVASGVVHVTAAGNDGRNAYESVFRTELDPVLAFSAHDFDPGDSVDVLQRFRLPEDQAMELVLQWDEPAFSISGHPGSAVNLDIHVVDDAGIQVLASAATDNIGGDPIEFLSIFNSPDSGVEYFNLLIVHAGGPAPGRIKYIIQGRFNGQILEHRLESSTIYGHANIAESISVGAVEWSMTPAYGIEKPLLRSFSSAGGGAVLFNEEGARYVEPRVANKPDVAAPDGVSTSFFNGAETSSEESDGVFVGTSAAAPHVAGVAALLLEIRPDLDPDAFKRIIAASAVDIVEREESSASMLPTGFDLDSGHGLIDARRAVDLALRYPEGVATQNDTTSDEVVAANADNVAVGGVIDVLMVILFLLVFVIRGLLVRLHSSRTMTYPLPAFLQI